MADYLQDIQKIAGNEYSFIVDDIDDSKDAKFIHTGSYIVNALISGSIFGGLPGNKITAIAGAEATGKTFFAFSIMRQFLKDNPKGSCIYFESEHAVSKDIPSKEMMKARGMDVKRVLVLPVFTIEQFRTQALKIAEKHMEQDEDKKEPLFMVLDSLGNLSTTKEISDMSSGSDKTDMTRARLVKGAFRVLAQKLGAADIPMLVTNHVYVPVGKMFPQPEMSGGSGIKYAASTIIYLSKRKEKDADGVIGNIIHCKTNKSRLTKENQMVDTLLTYDRGLNMHFGLTALAVKYDIFKKNGNRIEIPSGEKLYEKVINENPDKYFTEDILKQIDQAANKEFLYGSDYLGDE